MLSEKEEWQKKKESFKEMKDKLEEQNQTDAVKIQEFKVSQINATNECLKRYLNAAMWMPFM